MCASRAGRGRVDGRRTRAGGRMGTLQPWATPPGGTCVQAHPHLPNGPSVPGTPKHTPAARRGPARSLQRHAVSSLLFIRGLEAHASPVDAVRPKTQPARPLITQGRPVQKRREGGPECRPGWPSGHTVMLPRAESPASPHLQAGRPWPDPALAQGSDRVGVFV